MIEVDPVLDLTVPGKPRPQGSMTLARNPHTGKEFAKYGDETVMHRNLVVSLARGAWSERTPLEGPVFVRINATFARPKDHYGTGKNAGVLKKWAPRWHTSAPDGDKVARLVHDALTIAGVYRDDAQVSAHLVEKEFGEVHSTRVRVYRLLEGH